mmetsp:Transcript_90383/g.197973  ORF Transcript_90383/g.197973 Transcript_90383/m.197973 type:complete len:323 (+) Transcript_90383:442-1410(+)
MALHSSAGDRSHSPSPPRLLPRLFHHFLLEALAKNGHDVLVHKLPLDAVQDHVLESVHRPIVLGQEFPMHSLLPGIVQALLQVFNRLDVLIIDVHYERQQLLTLCFVLFFGVFLLACSGGHQEGQRFLGHARCAGGECHQSVHTVGVDRHADVWEQLEEQRRGFLDRSQTLEQVEIVEVPRATAVGQRVRDEANVLALALVGLVVVNPGKSGQFGVHSIDVVEVHEVLRDQLPISFDGVGLLAAELHVVQIVTFELLWEVSQVVREGRWIGSLIQEYDASKCFKTWNFLERERVLAFLGSRRRRSRLQRSVQSVGPPVVRAH